MQKTIAFTFLLAAVIGLGTASPAAAYCGAASPAELRAEVDKLNAQGLDAFRSVSMTEHRTFALSPVLRWYLGYLARSTTRPTCSRERQADLALYTALESVPARYFGSRVGSSGRLRGIVVFGQNATLDDSSFASFTPTMLPSFSDMRGTSGIRLDSTAGGLSLYLFDGTPNVLPRTIPVLQTRLDLRTWKEIAAQFGPKLVSRGTNDLSLDGRSLIRGSYGVATERVDLQLDSTAVHVLATIDINDTATNKANPIFGRMEPWEQKLWVLVDSHTGAIVDIGANIQETEP